MLENDKNLKNEGKKQKAKAKAKVKAKKTKNTVQNRQTSVRERLKNFFRYYLGRNAEKLFAVFNSRKAPYTGMAFLIFAGSCFFLCKNLFHLFPKDMQLLLVCGPHLEMHCLSISLSSKILKRDSSKIFLSSNIFVN